MSDSENISYSEEDTPTAFVLPEKGDRIIRGDQIELGNNLLSRNLVIRLSISSAASVKMCFHAGKKNKVNLPVVELFVSTVGTDDLISPINESDLAGNLMIGGIADEKLKENYV